MAQVKEAMKYLQVNKILQTFLPGFLLTINESGCESESGDPGGVVNGDSSLFF